MFKAILFDMDGTLVDTEPCGLKTLRIIHKHLNLKITKSDYQLFDKVWRRVGTNIEFEEFIKVVCNKSNINDVNDVIQEFFAEYKRQISLAEALLGANELLRYLKITNIPTSLVSASYKDQIIEVLNRHDWVDYFNEIIGFEQYKEKKPSPKGYLLAAKKLSVNIADCAVIEDSEAGIQSGKDAGAFVIAVRQGQQTQPQDTSKADIVLDNLVDTKKYLEAK